MQICVVGVGYWGPNLVRNFLFQDVVGSVYVCDTDQKRLSAIQKTFPMVKVEQQYERILENKEIDAIVVATPVSTHYMLAKKALLHGKHLLLEKPMTSNAVEAEELIEIAKERGLTLMVDHTFIYTSAVEKIKEIVSSGTMGEITYFDSTRINLGLFQHDTNVAWDLAPHDLSIMLHLIPYRPIAVMATGIDHLQNGLEDMVYMTLFFKENMIAHFSLSWVSPVKVRRTMIGCTKKMIVYDDMLNDEKIKVYDKGIDVGSKEQMEHALIQYRIGDAYSPALENREALSVEAAHFISCIQEGGTPITSGEHGLWVVKILEAVEQSIAECRKVYL